jgi:hypothetical protein
MIIVNKEDIPCLLELLNNEERFEYKNDGNFSININKKYTIIDNSFQINIRKYCREFLFKIKDHFELLNNDNLIDIFKFSSFILLFCPEFSTIYNIKKNIIKILATRFCDDLLYANAFSDFLFINFINEKFRKCSISWDYRLFLIKELHGFIEMRINSLRSCNDNRVFYDVEKEFKNFAGILDLQKSNTSLLFDLKLIQDINEKEKRNYHLWKYLLMRFNIFDKISDKRLLFSFALNCLSKDPLDYSAFSNIKFILQHLELESSQKIQLKNYFSSLSILFSRDDQLKYIDKLIAESFY